MPCQWEGVNSTFSRVSRSMAGVVSTHSKSVRTTEMAEALGRSQGTRFSMPANRV